VNRDGHATQASRPALGDASDVAGVKKGTLIVYIYVIGCPAPSAQAPRKR
jgi:hypothetical protein